MDAEPSNGHPALATGIPVAIVVAMHLALSTAIIVAVDPDVPDRVPYWLASVLTPSLGWAVLVIGRAAVWKRPSAFWLGASGGIVVLAGFVAAMLIYVSDFSARGVPIALIGSSWVLLGCAVAVAFALRLLGKQADAPIDLASADPTPAERR